MAQPTWITESGSLGSVSSNTNVSIYIEARDGFNTVDSYVFLSGTLPEGLSFSTEEEDIQENGVLKSILYGKISGTTVLVTEETSTTFVIRAKDAYGKIKDRTFSLTVTGLASPKLIEPNLAPTPIFSTIDSVWIEHQILYTNPEPTNEVIFKVASGRLPPGLELTNEGVIRGYPEPPTIDLIAEEVQTTVSSINEYNQFICLNTSGFFEGREIYFSSENLLYGGLVQGKRYYVNKVVDNIRFTISDTYGGGVLSVTPGTGDITTILPALTDKQPSARTYSFYIKLTSPLGDAVNKYAITVYNQQVSTLQGGLGKLPNTRTPVILNTKPLSKYIPPSDLYYDYYRWPETNEYYTYPTGSIIPIGTIESDNYFSFKVIGHDFDYNDLLYVSNDLPEGLTLDEDTGWITGTPILVDTEIANYQFSVYTVKKRDSFYQSLPMTFTYTVSNGVKGIITWVTDSNLGTIYNGTISNIYVTATTDTPLKYRLTELSGDIPPNLRLIDNGHLTGTIAYQPTSTLLSKPDTTSFTFTIEAYSETYDFIKSEKTFTVTVLQEFDEPTDILYIKSTPNIKDRILLKTLLNNTTIIPDEFIYRPYDVYYGKAKDIKYEHLFGIYASKFQQYYDAITKNHYWKSLTLGSIETAVARNDKDEIVYEVVYSKIIDDLMSPSNASVSKRLYWPRLINIDHGPWFTAVSNVYSSYDEIDNVDYVTSMESEKTRFIYPNSLENMRNRLSSELNRDYDDRLLPLWMTSQQANGSTTGYVPAWIICYTLPGKAAIIKNNIETMWVDSNNRLNKLHDINFEIDRITVNKSNTFDYNNTVDPGAWLSLPSAKPTPEPLNEKDFHVLFPKRDNLPYTNNSNL